MSTPRQLLIIMFATAEDALFSRMTSNPAYVLQPLLPDQSNHHYDPAIDGINYS